MAQLFEVVREARKGIHTCAMSTTNVMITVIVGEATNLKTILAFVFCFIAILNLSVAVMSSSTWLPCQQIFPVCHLFVTEMMAITRPTKGH